MHQLIRTNQPRLRRNPWAHRYRCKESVLAIVSASLQNSKLCLFLSPNL